MGRTTVWAVALLLAGGLACGGMGGGGGDGGSGPLTAQQLRDLQTRYESMYELIQSVRPMWLRTRGSVNFQDPSAALPRVFVDGVELGEPPTLRRINPSNVEEAEFLSASDATTLYGTGYPGGIIRVYTRG